MPAPLPAFFRSLRSLRRINALGVGCALGAMVGVAFGQLFGSGWFSEPLALATSLSTLLVGTVWIEVLHRIQGPTALKMALKRSVMLAIANAVLAQCLLCIPVFFSEPRGLLETLVVGFLAFSLSVLLSASFGFVVWGLGLCFVLLVFGLPLVCSRRLARKGLAGEERGEVVVGATVLVLSLLALGAGLQRPPPAQWNASHGLGEEVAVEVPRAPLPTRRAPDSPATWTLAAMGTAGLALGTTTLVLSLQRERRRRRFVIEAEAGRIPGYRVDASAEGKVLVRVARPEGEAYRAPTADDEELFALDEQGSVTQRCTATT